MNASLRGSGRQYSVAFRAMLVLTAVLGIVYPLTVAGAAQLILPNQANGSLVTYNGTIVGSKLIGQSFSTPKGVALAQWFQPRPSAAGSGYDARLSSGSNLGPNNPALNKLVNERSAAIEKADGVPRRHIPDDAITASASGLDPQISPAYAMLQVHRVAAARRLSDHRVELLVRDNIQKRDLDFLGEPTVNVLELNIALARSDPAGNR